MWRLIIAFDIDDSVITAACTVRMLDVKSAVELVLSGMYLCMMQMFSRAIIAVSTALRCPAAMPAGEEINRCVNKHW